MAVLDGVREKLSIPEEDMTILDGGVKQVSKELSEDLKGEVDLVVSSRVHAADKDLAPAIHNAYTMLRDGGVLLIRAPISTPIIKLLVELVISRCTMHLEQVLLRKRFYSTRHSRLTALATQNLAAQLRFANRLIDYALYRLHVGLDIMIQLGRC